MDRKIIISLLANTGIGNAVFRALSNNPAIIIDSVVTRKFDNKYPLYDTLELHQEAKEQGVKCFLDIDINSEYFNYVKNRNVDVILVATFNQIIKKNLLSLPKIKILNFHPSILPKYRGPSPIVWSILKGENKTGMTIHKLTEKIDAGDIILQNEITIEEKDTLGLLSYKLGFLAEEMTYEFIDLLINDKLNYKKQNESESSYFKRPTSERFFHYDDSFNLIERKLRAFHPFPGSIYIDEENNKFHVMDYWVDMKSNVDKKDVLILKKDGKEIFMKINTYSG